MSIHIRKEPYFHDPFLNHGANCPRPLLRVPLDKMTNSLVGSSLSWHCLNPRQRDPLNGQAAIEVPWKEEDILHLLALVELVSLNVCCFQQQKKLLLLLICYTNYLFTLMPILLQHLACCPSHDIKAARWQPMQHESGLWHRVFTAGGSVFLHLHPCDDQP
jgi:hypothetical protein